MACQIAEMDLPPEAGKLSKTVRHNEKKAVAKISGADETKFEFLNNLDHKHLDGPLRLTSYSATSENFDENNTSYDEAKLLNIGTIVVSDRRQCSTCSVDFTDREQQIEHYKLDWHHLNMKRKMRNYEPVTEFQFSVMMNNQSDVSSISASESEENSSSESSDQEKSSYDVNDIFEKLIPPVRPESNKLDSNLQQRENWKKSKLYFENSTGEILCIQRCLLHGKNDVPESEGEMVARVKGICDNLKWAIILVGGGHFAAAIFDKDEILNHKTFHRYTVRAKRGTAQFQRDSKQTGSNVKSAGATLRRYNEASLILSIQDLLSSWHNELNRCSLVFYRAASFNRSILFGDKNPPFKKDDKRLRNIPFATRRATFSEIQRIQKCLKTIEIIPKGSDLNQRIRSCHQPERKTAFEETPLVAEEKPATVSPSRQKKKKKTTKKRDEDPLNAKKRQSDPCLKLELEGDDEKGLTFNQLYTLCKSGNFKELNDLADSIPSSYLPEMINRQFSNAKLTLLHIAAKDSSNHIVKCLLHHGANPTVLDHQQQPPYRLAKDAETKAVFEEFKKEFPDRYNYEHSKIPDVETKAKKKKPKNKSKSKAKDKNAEDGLGVKNPNAVPCSFCESDISAKVPFECYNLKFCTTDCVRKFRTRQVRPK